MLQMRFVIAALAILMLAACSSGQPASTTDSPLALQPGNFTRLGGVQKNYQPTASDFTDLQAAEAGTLDQPALVEFYADY
ncbi:MAG TPA: hypothetical protein VF932_06450 [Anaerolineae bacterium]